MGDGLTAHSVDEHSRMSRMEEPSGARRPERTRTEWEGQKGERFCGRSEESQRYPGLSGQT